MEALQKTLIKQLAQVCQIILATTPIIERADVLINGAANWDASMTDQAIDTVPEFAEANLTAAGLADALYQLKAVRAVVNDGNLPSLILLASIS